MQRAIGAIPVRVPDVQVVLLARRATRCKSGTLLFHPLSPELTSKTMNHQYRKKPVVIEAFQMTDDVRNAVLEFTAQPEWPEWLAGAMSKDDDAPGCVRWHFVDQSVIIVTLEGNHRADVGDWIIQGVQGELYPCKPDIFEATYDKV